MKYDYQLLIAYCKLYKQNHRRSTFCVKMKENRASTVCSLEKSTVYLGCTMSVIILMLTLSVYGSYFFLYKEEQEASFSVISEYLLPTENWSKATAYMWTI